MSDLKEIREKYFEHFTWLSDGQIEYLLSLPGYDAAERRCGRCHYTGWHHWVSKGINCATKCKCVEMLRRKENNEAKVSKKSNNDFAYQKSAAGRKTSTAEAWTP